MSTFLPVRSLAHKSFGNLTTILKKDLIWIVMFKIYHDAFSVSYPDNVGVTVDNLEHTPFPIIFLIFNRCYYNELYLFICYLSQTFGMAPEHMQIFL